MIKPLKPRNLPMPLPSGGGVRPPMPPSGGGVGPHIPPTGGTGVGPHMPPSPRRRGRTIIDAQGYDVPQSDNWKHWAHVAGVLGITGAGGYLGHYLYNEGNNPNKGGYPTSPKPSSSGEMESLPSQATEKAKRILQPWEPKGAPEKDPRTLSGMSPIARDQLTYMNSKGMPTADQWSSYQSEMMNDPVKRAEIAQSMDAQRQNQYNANNRAPTSQENGMGIDRAYLQAERALMRGEITPDQMPIRQGTANQSQMDKAVANTMRTGIPLGNQYLQPNRQEQQRIGQSRMDELTGIYDRFMAGLDGEDGVSPKKARRR